MTEWQPSASINNLKQRAQILAQIRAYFAQQGVMEVDTAVMSHCAVSDPFIDSLEVSYKPYPQADAEMLYLQTSPEYAMKRLLAAGSGDIYQLGKVFRNGEVGRIHNPEFTMLEWYRLGMTDSELMDDVETLVRAILPIAPIRRARYQDIFLEKTGLDPLTASNAELAAFMRTHIEVDLDLNDRDGWLNLIMSHLVEPQLIDQPIFVTDYPESQAALARVRPDAKGIAAAARFELFIGGMELANGYHELTDAAEQQRRLEKDNQTRQQLELPQRPLEMRLVAALDSGFPDCAGVALGVDRLVMLALQTDKIADVVPFTFGRA